MAFEIIPCMIEFGHKKCNKMFININANHLAEVGKSNELKSICKIIEKSSEVIKYQFKSRDYEEDQFT